MNNLQLHKWQKEAIEYFNNNPTTLFEVVTGAGKTLLASLLLYNNKDKFKHALIIVPKNVILEKTWYPELKRIGFEEKDIGFWYGEEKFTSKIIITNIQTITKYVSKNEVFEDGTTFNPFLKNIDFIIFDEIHNYITPEREYLLKYKCPYKVGLSATISVLSTIKVFKLRQYFNQNLFVYKLKNAIQDKIVNEYVLNVIECPELLEEEKEDPIFTLISACKIKILEQILNKHRENKIIVFSSYVKINLILYKYFLQQGYSIQVLHTYMEKEEKLKILQDYKDGKFNILLTSIMLDEGYNLPSIDLGIIIGSATEKTIIQRVGRVIRKKQDASHIYLIFQKHDYKHLKNVINYLKDNTDKSQFFLAKIL